MELIKIAIVDDHKMVSSALENLLSTNPDFEVIMTCPNGDEFLQHLKKGAEPPEIVLMDVNMPIMNGIETTRELTKNYPQVRVLALTMEDGEDNIIKMLKAGAKGYLLKDMTSDVLFSAINTVHKYGYLHADGTIAESALKVRTEQMEAQSIIADLKEKEKQLIKLSCTEMTYKEIASVMNLSPKTVDNYRDQLFAKLNVRSRVGVVMFALKNNLD